MAVYEEYDHLMTLSGSPTDAIARYADADALNDRIAEWFQTPQGTLAHFPSWGSNLTQFKHEPQSATLEVVMEMAIIPKLSQDCGIAVRGIRVDFSDVDLCNVSVLYNKGIFSQTVNKNAF